MPRQISLEKLEALRDKAAKATAALNEYQHKVDTAKEKKRDLNILGIEAERQFKTWSREKRNEYISEAMNHLSGKNRSRFESVVQFMEEEFPSRDESLAPAVQASHPAQDESSAPAGQDVSMSQANDFPQSAQNAGPAQADDLSVVNHNATPTPDDDHWLELYDDGAAQANDLTEPDDEQTQLINLQALAVEFFTEERRERSQMYSALERQKKLRNESYLNYIKDKTS
jgi:hypothetical protein